jgi:hypothetical protein
MKKFTSVAMAIAALCFVGLGLAWADFPASTKDSAGNTVYIYQVNMNGNDMIVKCRTVAGPCGWSVVDAGCAIFVGAVQVDFQAGKPDANGYYTVTLKTLPNTKYFIVAGSHFAGPGCLTSFVSCEIPYVTNPNCIAD